ncbi:extracellular solute-binding protein [Aquibacillus halophilus]|uniref:Extracellular solute-binding protein n=1 Tax=Aquibacillus halophilus TaxID=930132 RepID=A0A6A8DCJ3_9BACI|nr:ABC transporter substrate-binding protein [Aquibacillus halophilus]MRH41599.1 extracellular solute-binding protein [Aquibacillus halophilus]
MFKMKKLIFILITMLFVSISVGCSADNTGGNDSSSDNNSESDSNSSSTDEVIELTLWNPSWKESIAPGLITEFEAQNPNIKVNMEFFPIDGMNNKYLLALMNDSGPDVMSIAGDWTAPFAQTGGLQPLNEFIEKDNLDLDDFYPGALQTANVDGSYYALPYRSETHALYYNKTLFEKNGLDPSKAPATFDELLEYSKKTTSDGTFGFGLVGHQVGNVSYQIMNFILSFGGEILNEDYTKSMLNEPEAIEAVKYYVDMHTEHGVAPESVMENDNTASRNLFQTGNVAMFLSGNYDIAPIQEANPDLDFGTALYPEKGERKLLLGVWSLAVTAFSEHPEAAWKLANFLAEPDNSVEYSTTFSARKSSADHEKYQDPLVKPFVEMIEYGVPMPAIPEMAEIRQIIHDNVQLAMMGQISAEEAMQTASDEVDAILE